MLPSLLLLLLKYGGHVALCVLFQLLTFPRFLFLYFPCHLVIRAVIGAVEHSALRTLLQRTELNCMTLPQADEQAGDSALAHTRHICILLSLFLTASQAICSHHNLFLDCTN